MLLLVGIWRYVGMRKLQTGCRSPPTGRRRARREHDYIVDGTMQGLALGSFCFIAIYFVARRLRRDRRAVCVTLGSTVTIAGRNYGSPRMVIDLRR